MKPAFYPFVVACIIYSSLSNSTPHHTPFMYQIKRTNNMGFLFKKGDSIPLSDLSSLRFLFLVVLIRCCGCPSLRLGNAALTSAASVSAKGEPGGHQSPIER